METTITDGSNEPTQDVVTSQEQGGEASAEVATGDESATPPASLNEETTQQPDEAVEEGEQADEFVKDEEGNEFIPRKAFESRIAKLTAQKHDAAAQILESLKSNPEALQKFRSELGIPDSASSEKSDDLTPDTSPFLSYLEKSVTKEHHDHYKGMAEAMYAEITPRLREMWQAEMNPLLRYIGKQQVNQFKSSHADYPKYAAKIQEAITSGRARSIEDAYLLISHEDKVKGAGASAVKNEQNRQRKMNTPIRRASGAQGNGQKKYTHLRDAIADAAKGL